MNRSVGIYAAVDIAVTPFAERNCFSELFKVMVCLENLS